MTTKKQTQSLNDQLLDFLTKLGAKYITRKTSKIGEQDKETMHLWFTLEETNYYLTCSPLISIVVAPEKLAEPAKTARKRRVSKK